MTVMKRDYSGKSLSPKANKVLLIVNIVLFFIAAAALGGSLYFKEEVTVVAMLLVMIVSCYNAFNAWRNLRELKKNK